MVTRKEHKLQSLFHNSFHSLLTSAISNLTFSLALTCFSTLISAADSVTFLDTKLKHKCRAILVSEFQVCNIFEEYKSFIVIYHPHLTAIIPET
jgi:hypothetical protein